MNTEYQKSTKINIFSMHILFFFFFLYICIYVYILHANITYSKYSHYETGSGCRKLIGAIQVWQLTMRILGKIVEEVKRTVREAGKRQKKKGRKRVLNNCGQAWLSPNEVGGGFGPLEMMILHFFFSLNIGLTPRPWVGLCTSRWEW